MRDFNIYNYSAIKYILILVYQ